MKDEEVHASEGKGVKEKRVTKLYLLLLENRPSSKLMWAKLIRNNRVKSCMFFKYIQFDMKHLHDSMLKEQLLPNFKY